LFLKKALVKKAANRHQEDLKTWLEATVPALHRPSASRAWVKYVLKEIASWQWLA
jgi:hypothetical protein